MGCAENSPLMAALEAMTACAQMTAVGNGMQLDVAMGIARKALGSVDVSGRRVRYADANSGIGFFAEAIRLVTGGEMEYVFRAEASPAIARGHDAAWARTGVARFSSSHLQQDVDGMVALGQVDIWQISPACYPITRNNRSPASARELETEEMLVQLACALAYVTRAEPRMVIIEDVVEFTKGLVWQRVRYLLPGQYNWTADVIDPIKHGGTAARERAWVVWGSYVIRRHATSLAHPQTHVEATHAGFERKYGEPKVEGVGVERPPTLRRILDRGFRVE